MLDETETGGFGAEARVMTPGGRRPIGSLRTGDMILTRESVALPVLAVIRHTGSALRIDGVTVGSCQHVIRGDATLQLHFGLDEALVPARAITGRMIGKRMLHALVLPAHAILCMEGLEADSVFVTEGMARSLPRAVAHRVAACATLYPEEALLWQAWRGDPAAARAA